MPRRGTSKGLCTFRLPPIGPKSGVPLIFCLRGIIDHWYPALLDVLVSERDVIVFDNCGPGWSSSTAPDTIDGW